jgi:ribosomal 50S subunit-recycling heat shock protein
VAQIVVPLYLLYGASIRRPIPRRVYYSITNRVTAPCGQPPEWSDLQGYKPINQFLFEIRCRIMRLDKYLKISRLIKRRTVANEACDNGRILVNGRIAKASYDVKVGDRLEIQFGQRTLTVEVLAVNEYATKSDAPAMYREIL